MQFPIHIELRRSRLLTFFLLLFHALAAGCVIALPWHWLLRLLLLALIGLSARRTLTPPKIVGLRLSVRAGLDCQLPGGELVAAAVFPDSAVFNQLIVLRMRIYCARRTVSLALLPDSMSSEQFRVLRLWLRWRDDASAIDTKSGINVSVGKDV